MDLNIRKIAFWSFAIIMSAILLIAYYFSHIEQKHVYKNIIFSDGYVVDGFTYKVCKEIESRVAYLNQKENMRDSNYTSKFRNYYPLTLIFVKNGTYVFRLQFKDKNMIFKYNTNAIYTGNEVAISRRIKHENIVEIYYAFYCDNSLGYFIVMEPMDLTLTIEYAKNHQNEFKPIMKSIVYALKYLNSRNIIHCDIKLSNILIKFVNNKPIYKLCDFGGAIYIYFEKIYPIHLVFTDAYVAPETYFDNNYTRSTDIWMLGHTMWYFIEKKVIFMDVFGRYYDKAYVNYLQGKDNVFIKHKYKKILTGCTKKDPKKRISYDKILELLD